MIKALPGWLNFIILFSAYALLAELLNLIFFKLSIDHRFIALICAFFCGAYLAKWRFDSSWHFW